MWQPTALHFAFLHAILAIPVSAQIDYGLVDWVTSLNGGLFNEKQEIRRIDSLDEESIIGVFATKDIKQGELLLQVPWSAIISAEANDDDDEATLECGLARNLAEEMKLGNTSQYAPFVNYLNSQPYGQIPSFWSNEGKNLLLDILGGWEGRQVAPPLVPFAWMEEWYGACGGDPNDGPATHAAMLVVQAENKVMMVPLYDFYNHQNGELYNSFMIDEPGIRESVYASRDIKAGEQIYKSYNECPECHDDYYGTAEIFRDHGFVESYPQKWVFLQDDMAFEIIEGDDGQLEVDWLSHEPTIPVFRYTLQKMLRQHVSRLYKVRNVAYNVKMSDIPEQEWNLIFEYHKIMTDALSLAFNSLVDDEEDWFPVSSVEGVCTMKDVNSPSCGNRNHYDYLESEPDDLDYVSPTCDNWEWMLFEDYQPLENMTTSYQKVLFRRQSETGDVCMEIEEVVQICSSYRPQYHEFSANFPGRFVSEVKRVLFVGGGDSMLLHETLKYPSLKKVVGLELDQVITRKSFQYFDTQPHFDDDRVEWWFGDATKTLLLLPKDYWASFDLVLVDLSETAMALSVTEELDVFAALALLLKPEGIMVKNELYIEEMSDVFDYTVQIRYDSPKICSQIMVMGSNRVDFFHDLPVDHQIHNNLLLPLDQISNRYEFMHDYRKNDARLQGKCDSVTTADENKEQEISAGILHVIDFEDVQGEVKLEKTLYQVIQEAGLTPISSPTSDDTDATLVIVILQEGYVIARAWPDHKYSAIGINLWGSFHKGQVLQNHLLRAFDTSSISSFRVVVGGMYGLTTWREDQLLIGPQVVQNRNCEIPSTEDSPATGEISMIELFSEFVFDQLLNIVHDNDLVVGVLCSFENEHCAAKEALEKSSKVDHIVTFWTCPALRTLIEVDEDEEVSYEEFSNMFSCEKAMIQQLQEVVDVAKSLIDVFVVDSNAPFEMVQVFNSIWSLSKYRQYLEEERSLFLALSTVPDAPFQRHFLDRYRKDVRYDPTTRAEFILYDKGSKSSPLEIGIVSVGDEFIFQSLDIAERTINEKLQVQGLSRIQFQLRKINGAQWNFQHDFEPREFSHSDYDSEPAKQQFSEQQSLGRETIFQLISTAKMPSIDELCSYLRSCLEKIGFSEPKLAVYNDIGEGVVIVSTHPNGNVVLVWDGRDRLNINLFNHNDLEEVANTFVASFTDLSGDNLIVALRDDYPRGTGRVLNFSQDILETKRA